MKKILTLWFLLWTLCASNAYARETAVLLPVVGPLTSFELTEITREVVAGFAAGFELKHGEAVNQFVKQVFQEESKNADCDEANCYRRIAAQYQAEKIVAMRLTQIEAGQYLLTLNVYDVITGDVALSQKRECTSCTFEKIRILTGELVSTVSASK